MRRFLSFRWASFLGAVATVAACGGSSTTDFANSPASGRGGDGAAGTTGGAAGSSSGSGATSGTAGTSGTSTGGASGSASGGASTGGSGGAGQSGTSGRSGTGGSGQSGSSGTSGTGSGGAGGTGATGGSGAAASGGTGGICECPAIACLPTVALTVEADATAGPGAVIEDLHAQGTGLHVYCMAVSNMPCTWRCESQEYTVPGGDYSVTLSAPGFGSKTVDFTVATPTNCGCCGCGCSIGTQQTVTLVPDSTLQSGGCCADLANDPANCGSCGHACPRNECVEGACAPNLGACLFGGTDVATNEIFDNCDGYCASVGQVCSATCGTNHDEASEEWLDTTENCYGTPDQLVVHGCADAFERQVDGQVPEYDCCCGDAKK